MLLPILLLFLAIFYFALLLLYAIGWQRIKPFSLPPNFFPSTSIAVIIPARNEADNIGRCLTAVLEQQYPPELLQLIVIDDHSTDNTAAIVATNYPQVKLLRLSEHIAANHPNNISPNKAKPIAIAYKKKAIETAILQTQQELIVTTDADCFMNEQWLLYIAAFYETHNKPQMIAAPVCYTRVTSFFATFQALDFAGMIVATGASLHWGLSDMCNGANLAYQRAAFFAVKGFSGIDDIASGDDMLLMNKIRHQYPNGIFFLKNKAATVYTYPQPTLQDFARQRLRWASKSGRYADRFTLPALASVYLFNLSLITTSILLLLGIFRPFWPYLVLQIGLKLTADAIFLYTGTYFFGQKRWLYWFFPAQLLHIFYIVLIGTIGNLKTYQWKGRKVK